jgi:hypothetical protein
METKNICNLDFDREAYNPQKIPVTIDVAVILVQKSSPIGVPTYCCKKRGRKYTYYSTK